MMINLHGGVKMHILRKVIGLIGILLFSLSSYTYAQMVQISDTGAYQLFTMMNQANQIADIDCPVTNFHHIGILSENSPYDIYISVTGPYGHGTVISFYSNKAGFVSKVTTMCALNDKEALTMSAKSMMLVLLGLGLSSSEAKVLLAQERLVNQRHSDVWAAKINRRIVLDLIPYPATNVLVSRFTAYDS